MQYISKFEVHLGKVYTRPTWMVYTHKIKYSKCGEGEKLNDQPVQYENDAQLNQYENVNRAYSSLKNEIFQKEAKHLQCAVKPTVV